MSDLYLRKYNYGIYYAYIGLKVHGILHGIAIFKEYWYGRRVDRLYAPTQPRTGEQQGNRFLFYQGIQYWKGFDSATKSFYAKEAEGYKLYGIHRWLTKYLNFQNPMIIYWGILEKSNGDNQTVDAAIAAAITAAKLAMFPVGSIFTNITNTNPHDFLGGTWAAFGAGKVLVGLDAGDADFDTPEETGGAKTVASSAQAFTGTPSTVVVNHKHTSTFYVGTTDGTYGTFDSSSTTPGTAKTIQSGNPDSGGAANYTPAGGNAPGAATSVVQPYIVVYFFKRTA